MARWNVNDRTPLALLRANAGFSAENAATFLGVVMATLYRYENGVSDIPLGVAEKMASLYKISFNELREAARITRGIKKSKNKIKDNDE